MYTYQGYQYSGNCSYVSSSSPPVIIVSLEKLLWCGNNDGVEVYNGCCNTTGEGWLSSTGTELHKMHISKFYTLTLPARSGNARPLRRYAQAGNAELAITVPASLVAHETTCQPVDKCITN